MESNRRLNNKWLMIMNIASLVFAISGLAYTLYRDVQKEKLELTCEGLANAELTQPPAVEGLKVEYTYHGQPVDHLWLVQLRLINTGTRTIIGRGEQSMLVADKELVFKYPSDVNIRKIDKIADEIGIAIHFPDSNIFSVGFEQWRAREGVRLSLYISSAMGQKNLFLPEIGRRQIIDGDILSTVTPVSFGRDELPPSWVVKGIIALTYSIPVILVFYAFAGYRRVKYWRMFYKKQFGQYLSTLGYIKAKDVATYSEFPYQAPVKVWDEFDGETAPMNSIFYDPFKICLFAGFLAMLFPLVYYVVIVS